MIKIVRILNNRVVYISLSLLLFVLGIYLVMFVYKYPRISNVEYSYEISNSSWYNIDGIKQIYNGYIDDGYFVVDTQQQKTNKEENEFVQNIKVIKHFPNTLEVQIKTYTPYLIINNGYNCIVLQEDGYVISHLEYIDGKCSAYITIYNAILLDTTDLLTQLPKGSKSDVYVLSFVKTLDRVFSDYGFKLDYCSLVSDILRCYPQGGRTFVFSVNQTAIDQVIRMSAVFDELTRKNLTFKQLDLRYKRPVISQ